MKINSSVFGVQIAVLCVFALTQGCVTTESQGSGRGAGARRKGPWKHEHKGKNASASSASQHEYSLYEESGTSIVDENPVIIENSYTSTVEPNPDPVSTSNIYIVQKGDILSQLAADFDTTTATLVEMNSLANPDVLFVGQELRVPTGRGTSKATISKSSSSIQKGGQYTIQKGDTLSGIASSAGVSLADLRSLNNIQGDMIRAGETISIPSYGKVPSSSKKASKKKVTPSAPVVEKAAPVVEEPAPAPMEFAPAVPEVEPIDTESMSVDMVIEDVKYENETLDDMAKRHGVSKADILRLNNLSDESQVMNGQTLRIPVGE
ncbi:MAG TPA: LysM peptidoglycan-binding domain-containing protein [Pontiella sp.]